MNCKTCGKELRKDAKFCTECGTKVDGVKVETKTTTTTSTTTTNVPISNSKATASMVLGIISLVICAPLLLVFSITGLILGITQQGKSGIKTAGIIINAISIGLGVLFWIIFGLLIVVFYKTDQGVYYESTEESNGNSDIITNYDYDLEDYYNMQDSNYEIIEGE